MKTKYLLLGGLIVGLGSCSTAYRTGQTPDDVYYSPAPAAEETYVTTDNSSDRNTYNYRNAEEREIRRAIRDPYYRSIVNLDLGFGYGYSPYMYNPYSFNNFGYSPYGYSPYAYSPYGYKGFYDPIGYNPYSYGYGYNPFGYGGGYYGGGFFGGGYYPVGGYYPNSGTSGSNANTSARRYNLGAYNNSASGARISSGRNTGDRPLNGSAPVRSFGTTAPSTRQTNVGSTIRKAFSSRSNERRSYTPVERSTNRRSYDNNSNNERRSTPTRTFETPSRSFENSSPVRVSPPSSSSNNSSAPVRTFRKN